MIFVLDLIEFNKGFIRTVAFGLIPLLNEMENRKEIQKAQKAPKPKKTKTTTFWGTMVAAEKVFFWFS